MPSSGRILKEIFLSKNVVISANLTLLRHCVIAVALRLSARDRTNQIGLCRATARPVVEIRKFCRRFDSPKGTFQVFFDAAEPLFTSNSTLLVWLIVLRPNIDFLSGRNQALKQLSILCAAGDDD